MQIKNKYFPYPVIAEGNDTYDGSSFSTSADYEKQAYNIIISISASLNDFVLSDLVSRGAVKYAHHIECQQTCFRTLILSDEPRSDVHLHESKLNGLVQICSFLMADQEIRNYENPRFNKDYSGFRFNIERGCVLAIGSQINLYINKEKEDLEHTSSIFTIRKNYDPNAKEILINTTNDKIVVLVPEKTSNQYQSISNTVDFLPVLHSMLILPSLMQVLFELRDAAQQNALYNYEGLRWYRSLRKTAQKLNLKFDADAFLTMDALKTAQLFLDTPVVRALDNICSGDGENI